MANHSTEYAMREKTTSNEKRAAVRIEPLLLRKCEAAAALGMSPRMFDDLLLAGLISKTQIGGLVLFDVEELRAFVRSVRSKGLTKHELAGLIDKNKSKRGASPAKSMPA